MKRARLYSLAAVLIVFTLFAPAGHSTECINIIYPSISDEPFKANRAGGQHRLQ